MKVYPHDEILRTVSKGHRDVLDALVARSTLSRKMTHTADEAERDRLARLLKCSAKSVANALSALSRPAYDGGPELLIRLRPGVYRLNPAYYFIGSEDQRDAAIEMVVALRQGRLRQRDQRSTRKKRAKVLPLTVVNVA